VHLLFGAQHGAIARVPARQLARPVVFDTAAALDHQHAVEGLGLGDVVRHAQQRGLLPPGARFAQQFVALRAVRPRKGSSGDQTAPHSGQVAPSVQSVAKSRVSRVARTTIRPFGTCCPAGTPGPQLLRTACACPPAGTRFLIQIEYFAHR
jgi:hypothetical protein